MSYPDEIEVRHDEEPPRRCEQFNVFAVGALVNFGVEAIHENIERRVRDDHASPHSSPRCANDRYRFEDHEAAQ